MLRLLNFILPIWLAMAAGPAQAQMPPNVGPGELARLPEYCPVTQSFAEGGFPSGPLPSQQPWIARMGPGFWAVHHYCWALINASRAEAPGVGRAAREHLLHRAIDDVNYVLRNSPADFVLAPELLLRNGDYYEKLGLPVQAMESFELSRRAKPDYWPAYTRLAALQARLGKRDAAIQVLDEGLAILPDHPELSAAKAALSRRGSAARPAVNRQATNATVK
ncbi:MAG: tetratricopeptide repeat protein [Rubrivivax sp.]|nr:tetratricopeptide repeat protein [Rubrivivax sp.]